MKASKTFEETLNSITGWDEIAVAKHFDGLELYVEGQRRPGTLMRALVFVLLTRADVPPVSAYQQVMGMTGFEVNECFLESPAEDEPDDSYEEEPVSDLGQGSSELVSPPSSSWPSPSLPASSPPSFED